MDYHKFLRRLMRTVPKILIARFKVGLLPDVAQHSTGTSGSNPTLNRQNLFLRKPVNSFGGISIAIYLIEIFLFHRRFLQI